MGTYSDERGTYILRWTITRDGKVIRGNGKPFKIYIDRK